MTDYKTIHAYHLDNATKKLLLESRESDSKIDDGKFYTILRGILRVTETG